MDYSTVFDDDLSNLPEWEKGKTYYALDMVSYQGERYEAVINIKTSEIPPDLCSDYKKLKKGTREVRGYEKL